MAVCMKTREYTTYCARELVFWGKWEPCDMVIPRRVRWRSFQTAPTMLFMSLTSS